MKVIFSKAESPFNKISIQYEGNKEEVEQAIIVGDFQFASTAFSHLINNGEAVSNTELARRIKSVYDIQNPKISYYVSVLERIYES